ncbi:phosphotransferase [Microbacterium sp. cx-55]|uniref:aminoglycoside phosphotransferase family protein n=1 Tax=unclassified Microbacterium TaxID=2609290 RepID=UPI001CC079C8|nr:MULTISPECIES: aminoglycoside phosphotransferase family protein [unclassified Microbacterium]MBZ4487556.1 phosphotransferase [Microbacterium sp. cx-55]MCC4908295.1 phosphotransferase [Microbacterium sp. cx-59]UGB35576.1 phosphotransferase [Microbacterium sp. cx-55]
MSAPIARGRSSEVFADDPGHVVKLYFAGADEVEVDREVRDSRTVHALGITPVRCYGRVERDGRHGIVFDRIDGIPLTTVAERNILRLPEVGRTLADEHVAVHAAHTTELQDVRALALAQIDKPSFAALTIAERESLRAHLRSLPDGDAVLHLDFHPQNVFVLADRNVVIDWQTAVSGDPAADVALTCLLFREAELFPGTSAPMRVVYAAVRRVLLRHYLAEYLRRSTVTPAQIERWTTAARVLRLGLLDVASERERMLAGIRRDLAARASAQGPARSASAS